MIDIVASDLPLPLPKILVVDDIAANRLALRTLLRHLEAEVLEASTGSEALIQALNERPAVILLATHMPGMDGYEVANLLRGKEDTCHIPIIFITAFSKDVRYQIAAYGTGAVDFLEKPIDESMLLVKVGVFLDLYRQRQRLQALVEMLEEVNRQLSTEVAQRVTAEQELRKLSEVVRQSPAGVMITDTAGNIQFVNEQFQHITGYEPHEVIGKNPRFLQSGATLRSTYEALWRALAAGEVWRGELHNRAKDGRLFWEYATIAPIRDTDGRIIHYAGLKEDITLRKEYEAQLLRQINYDDTTGLPNRILVLDRLSQAMMISHRATTALCVLLVDLDGLKRINDTLGRTAGDEVLIEVAARLRALVRQGDTVARIGGDEFLLVLPNFPEPVATERVARQILTALSRPLHVAARDLVLSAGVGITCASNGVREPQILIQNAEAAMYRAKEQGPNSFAFFTPELTATSHHRLALEIALRQALEQQALEVQYQPIVALSTGVTIGVEALVRWHHPQWGQISPEEFVPVAEAAGLVQQMDLWVLEQAIQELDGRPHLRLAVNTSPPLFEEPELAPRVLTILRCHSQPPHLEIEITERLLLKDRSEVQMNLQALIAAGVGLSIDDFGTGYSALGYLRRLALNNVKIDRSFVQTITEKAEDAELVRAIIAMAHALRLEVIAEGVETVAQQQMLRDLGCDLAQGWLYSQPLSATDLNAFLGS